MCGIVGYVGYRPASELLLDGLSRLEYRGYDSAGIAVVQDRDIAVRKRSGRVAGLIQLVESGDINNTTAKAVLEEVFNTGKSPTAVVEARGYAQISDSSVVEAAVAEAIEANPKAVDDFRKGKDTAARFLVGQVMKIRCWA